MLSLSLQLININSAAAADADSSAFKTGMQSFVIAVVYV
jgi:hypothetical protein